MIYIITKYITRVAASINRRYTTGFPVFPFNSLSANRKTQIIGGTKET